jgi:predicted MFS family arabinose efflux permease
MRNNNITIVTAGIISLIVGVGLARFAFTSLLPNMLDDFLTVRFTGVLASLNYVGYMSGTMVAVFITNINTKVKLFRLGLVLSVATTMVLSLTTNPLLWILSRVVAGFGTSMVLIVGASIVMLKLNFDDKKKAMGWYFAGIGASVVVMELMVRVLDGFHHQTIWAVGTICCAMLAVYPYYVLSFDRQTAQNAPHHKLDKSIFSTFVLVLTIVYMTEGTGFVVLATFLPDIINSVQGLEGFGSNVWLVAGVAGIPSSVILMTLAQKHGSINTIILTMLLQVVAILIPTITDNIYLNLLSGVLYGGTFVGLVALFMNLAGEIARHNPVVLMATFTTAYGIGQILAPLYSVALIQHSGSYDMALYLTGFVVFCGALLLQTTKRHHLYTA